MQLILIYVFFFFLLKLMDVTESTEAMRLIDEESIDVSMGGDTSIANVEDKESSPISKKPKASILMKEIPKWKALLKISSILLVKRLDQDNVPIVFPLKIDESEIA
ncbi:BED zinc finger [Prunus dulcis]|uniref:BED zinc finger n=1 Tax=Prunus dulcis TaxID=3755 RepID=A0A4Y1RN20_PRUDU|nr:BED zinc finger [Prunus dulcis]